MKYGLDHTTVDDVLLFFICAFLCLHYWNVFSWRSWSNRVGVKDIFVSTTFILGLLAVLLWFVQSKGQIGRLFFKFRRPCSSVKLKHTQQKDTDIASSRCRPSRSGFFIVWILLPLLLVETSLDVSLHMPASKEANVVWSAAALTAPTLLCCSLLASWYRESSVTVQRPYDGKVGYWNTERINIGTYELVCTFFIRTTWLATISSTAGIFFIVSFSRASTWTPQLNVLRQFSLMYTVCWIYIFVFQYAVLLLNNLTQARLSFFECIILAHCYTAAVTSSCVIGSLCLISTLILSLRTIFFGRSWSSDTSLMNFFFEEYTPPALYLTMVEYLSIPALLLLLTLVFYAFPEIKLCGVSILGGRCGVLVPAFLYVGFAVWATIGKSALSAETTPPLRWLIDNLLRPYDQRTVGEVAVTTLATFPKPLPCTGVRLYVLLLWLVGAIVLALTTYYMLGDQRFCSSRRTLIVRKSYHVACVLSFLPLIIMKDLGFLTVSVGIGAFLFVSADIFRQITIEQPSPEAVSGWHGSVYKRIMRGLAESLHKFIRRFADWRDLRGLTLTPLYLLLGVGIPIMYETLVSLCTGAPLDSVAACSGLLSVGLADAAASLLGIYFGRHSIAGRSKTYEGLGGYVLSYTSAGVFLMLLLPDFTNYSSSWGAHLVAIVLTGLYSGCFESLTREIDNLIVPLFTLVCYRCFKVVLLPK